MQSLTAGLNEIRADNKQLRTLVEGKQEAKGNLASSPTRPIDGGASAQISQPAHAVTLPELRAMANLSRKGNRRVAQLGLADSSDSSDSDVKYLRKKENISEAGKSLRSGKDAKITSTVLYPQSGTGVLIGNTVYSRSNWNLEVLVFMEGGKLENPEKNPRSKDENQQQTQPTYGTGSESNPGHIGGRRRSCHCATPAPPYEGIKE